MVKDNPGAYLVMDVDPVTGVMHNRWTTPYEMTGENNCLQPCTSGGITTQNAGPNPTRARIRATKAPAGLLSQPTRNIRVAVRSFCKPVPAAAGSPLPYDQALLDACLANIPAAHVANGLEAGQYFAPVFEYIFPETAKAGDPIVPNDLWHLPALRNGEGAGGVGPLTPTPW